MKWNMAVAVVTGFVLAMALAWRPHHKRPAGCAVVSHCKLKLS
jgi:hypothetical protein